MIDFETFLAVLRRKSGEAKREEIDVIKLMTQRENTPPKPRNRTSSDEIQAPVRESGTHQDLGVDELPPEILDLT